MGTVHKNQTQLARALGFSPQALNKWREMFPDACPHTLDVTDWRKFIEEQGCGFRRDLPADNREPIQDAVGEALNLLFAANAKIEAIDPAAAEKFKQMRMRVYDVTVEMEALIETI